MYKTIKVVTTAFTLVSNCELVSRSLRISPKRAAASLFYLKTNNPAKKLKRSFFKSLFTVLPQKSLNSALIVSR